MIIDLQTRYKIGQRIYYIEWIPEPKIKEAVIDELQFNFFKGGNTFYYKCNQKLIEEKDIFDNYIDAKEFFGETRRKVI